MSHPGFPFLGLFLSLPNNTLPNPLHVPTSSSVNYVPDQYFSPKFGVKSTSQNVSPNVSSSYPKSLSFY